MAEFRWRGNGAGTKTAWNDGRNWVDGSGAAYAQTVYPGDATRAVNDDVVFDSALATGASSPAGYDATALTALRSLRIGTDYDGSIASAAAWLLIECVDVNIAASGASDIYIKGVNTAGITTLTLQSGDTVYLDGTIKSIIAIDGTSNLAATTVCATALTIGGSTNSTLNLTITAGATIPATVYCNSGTISNGNSVATALHINGGTWTQTAGDIAALHMNGGKLVWNDGNVTAAYVLSGELDGSGSANPRRLGDATLYPGGTINLDDGVGSVLITGAITNYGGAFTAPNGAQLQQYAAVTYAGASDAKYGAIPQTINNTSVNGDAVYLGENDRLEVYCQCGALSTSAAVTFKIYEDDANDFASEAATSYYVTFADTDDNKTKLLTVWGYQLTSGKPWCRIKVTEAGTANAVIAAQYRKLS